MSESREQLMRDMEEVLCLPDDHPQRKTVLQRIEAAGPWAHEAWADRLKDDERLRMGLRAVSTPAGLDARLRAIATESPPTRNPWNLWQVMRAHRLRLAWPIAVAASLLLVVLAGLQFWSDRPDFDRTVSELVRLALADHQAQPALSVASGETEVIREQLQDAVTFAIHLPEMGSGLVLAGGRICAFDERPLVYTRWLENGKAHSLYQLCAADFDLPEQFPPQRVEMPAVPDHPRAYYALIWSAGECAYVMICEDAVPDVRVGQTAMATH